MISTTLDGCAATDEGEVRVAVLTAEMSGVCAECIMLLTSDLHERSGEATVGGSDDDGWRAARSLWVRSAD
jgi:hypothetical protein